MSISTSHPLEHKLTPLFPVLRKARSVANLQQMPEYQQAKPEIDRVLNSVVYQEFAERPAENKPFVRAVAWNGERGLVVDGLEEVLRTHPLMSQADIIFMPELDYGMARTKNRDVSRELAEKLGLNYAFAPCYINLDKGSGIESDVDGHNSYGVHGNTVFSRYPMRDLELISFRNGKDKMRGKEKRLGSQSALLATVDLPQGPLRICCVHLDAHSSQQHRREQMSDVLRELAKQPTMPALIGGDWNTSTYNSSKAVYAIIGFWRRVFMGVSNVIRNHYPYPDRWFERHMFRDLEEAGFDYRSLNEAGGCTVHYNVHEIKARRNLGDWVPGWCFRFIDWSLRNHNGTCSLKLDWFAGRGVQAAQSSKKNEAQPPQVIGDLKYQGEPISDHDAILIDLTY